MYFTAWVEGQSHIWRQRFPEGKPEQITFGPTEEDGIAMEPDGRALITSVGVHESSLWIHDERGERPLSSEGDVVVSSSSPAFGPDPNVVYYLLRRRESSDAELWRTIVDSGKSDAVFSGISMIDFDISPDGKQVVYTTAALNGTTRLWIAPVDGSLAAMKLDVSDVQSPHFGADGQILVQRTEGNKNYLEQFDSDGSHRSKIVPYPIGAFQSVSPGRRWVTAEVPRTPDTSLPAIMAIPLNPWSPKAHLRALVLNEVVHGREVPVCVRRGFIANRSGAKPGNPRRSGGKPAGSSRGRYRATGRTERGSGSGIGGARSTGAGQRPRALCLGEYHGPPEPVPGFASLTAKATTCVVPPSSANSSSDH